MNNNNKNNGYLLIISAVILWSLSGLRQVTMERAVIICLAEPILNPIWVYLGNGEVPSMTTVIGVSFILLGAITGILFTSKAKKLRKIKNSN
ncbi:hypothetical protein [Fusobacterium pseudoperiodonticum]|uniref:hypothetical protein n=1 Tax=Fusobacterium pseudoperiodonticum TaxID=2663009 RepID=UPI0028EFCEE7|nr:hypothetical protein [Fusobacterium pseudoperiodonticum]